MMLTELIVRMVKVFIPAMNTTMRTSTDARDTSLRSYVQQTHDSTTKIDP